MSQQPPYGQDPQQPYGQGPQQPYPQQPYQQPYPPYGQGPYPNPYAQLPQNKSNTTRNVLLIVGAVVLLFCGGIVAFFVWVVNNVDDALDPDYPGSDKDPLTVAEGEAFSIRGFDYDAGWTVDSRDGEVVVEGLKATNDRDDQDATSAYPRFRFYLGNEQQATVYCDGVFDIAYERSVRFQCSTYGAELVDFDEIEVFDSSYGE